jgi:uncharacterized protein (TIGR00645 family)
MQRVNLLRNDTTSFTVQDHSHHAGHDEHPRWTAPHPTAARGAPLLGRRDVFTTVERMLYACRIALIPMALGLSLGVVLILFKFVIEIVEIVEHIFQPGTISDEQILIMIISLVDLFLIAGLLIIVMLSGYDNFVSKLHIRSAHGTPDWIGSVKYHDLKVNLGLTIVAISMVQLLKVFLSIEDIDPQYLPWLIGLHVTFLGSTMLLALSRWLSEHEHERAEPFPRHAARGTGTPAAGERPVEGG